MIFKFRGKAVEGGGGRGTEVLRYKRIQNGGFENMQKTVLQRLLQVVDLTVFEKKVMCLPRLKFVEVVLAFLFPAVVLEREPAHTVFYFPFAFVTVTQKEEKRQKFAPRDFRMESQES